MWQPIPFSLNLDNNVAEKGMTPHTFRKRCENNAAEPNVDETGINRDCYRVIKDYLYPCRQKPDKNMLFFIDYI